MAVEIKDVEQVAEELGARFNEFKSKNDQALEGVKKNQTKLTETVDSLNEKLTELSELKSELEDELLSLKRPTVGRKSNEDPEYKNTFLESFVRKGKEDQLEALLAKSVQTAVDADGGFGVPEELDRNLIELAHNEVVMRQACNVVTVGTPEWKRLVNLGGAASGWVGETDKRPETNSPRLKEVSTVWGELYANPQATQRSLDDIFFSVENWLTSELNIEFSEEEEKAFTNGDGSNKPKGLWTYGTDAAADATRPFGTFQHFETAAASTISGDDILSVIYGTRKAYRNGASFMMNGNVQFAIRKLKDSEGNYLWAPGLQVGQPAKLLGYGIMENEFTPDVADEALPIGFGNFKRAYTIVDRMGTRMLRDPYTNKPYVGFYTTKRVGSMMTNSQAVKFLKVKKA